ncbi:hypothetical protein ACP275_04G064800 [Erythranthe tilingii]
MAMNFFFILYLIFTLTILAQNQGTKVPSSQIHPQGNLQVKSTRCTSRCSKTAFKKPCMYLCKKCCSKCLCVPPGTYGNNQLCPCYNNWKTKRGGPKCP